MSRYFGVELEFAANDSFSRIMEAFAQKGLEVVNRGGWGGSNGENWELKNDSTAGSGGGTGYEVASRKMRGNEGLQELEWYLEAMSSLREARGWKVNRYCGLHVNIDVSDFTIEHLRNFIKLMLYYEQVMYGLNPPSRRGNTYCHHIQGRHEYEYLAGMRGPLNPVEVRRIVDGGNKYSGVNIKRFFTKGRIEIRYGGSTLNAKKVMGWTCFLLGIVEKAKNSQRIRVSPKATTGTLLGRKDEARALMSNLRGAGLTYKVSTAYKTVNKRFAKFSSANAECAPVYGGGY